MILMAVVFLGQGKRRCKGHIFKCRTLKRNFVQRRLAKLDTDEGQPVKTNPSQIAMIEINAVKDTVLKDRFSKVGLGQLDIDQLYIGELRALSRYIQGGAYKDGFAEARILKVSDGKVAVCQICAVKIGFTRIDDLKRAAGQVSIAEIEAKQCAY